MTVVASNTSVTAFEGPRRISSGPLSYVVRAVRSSAQSGFSMLIFDDATGRTVEVDLRGSEEDVLARLSVTETPARGPGRPKLGVTAREVTLLPRHWEWLAAQPGGASVALRKLVEEASKSPAAMARKTQEATYRFMSVMAGDLPDFEEATRALFAGDAAAFAARTRNWPQDIGDYARDLAAPMFPTV